MKSAAPGTNRSPIPDAIVLSGWTWEAFNVPERISLALAHRGARVLYCENPVSFFRGKRRPRQQVERGIYRAGLSFLGQRLNRFPLLFPPLQSKLLVAQILRHAADLRLQDPIVVYPHGDFVPLCLEFKKRGFFLVHVCMDYPESGHKRLMELSDLILVIPKSLYQHLRTIYGSKVRMIPQVNRPFRPDAIPSGTPSDTRDFPGIGRPRLGYVGPVEGRLNLPVLNRVLSSHPEWQFVHVGASKCLPLSNVHALPWRSPEELRGVVANLDLGFMPYGCDNNKNLHCMPLKLFDYFALGKPVVSTRILNLLEFADTIYFGDDARELCGAIEAALEEPPDSPLKAKRIGIAQENSIEALARVLAELLPCSGKTSHAAAVAIAR